ncbi:hypothetical protein HY745_05185 [Candidatus Desantisbacteria bacterium]|nr:hypothetical protein [Candidatus Desantisbacteria bacterium]
MKNFHKSYLVFLFLLLISFFLKVKPISCLSRIKIGDTVSDFTALDLNNNKVQFSYYLNNKDNKLITLLFWNVQPDSTLRKY